MINNIYELPKGKAIDEIVGYALYRYALHLNVDEVNAYRQLMYVAGRGSANDITEELKKLAEDFAEDEYGCDAQELIGESFCANRFDEDFSLTDEVMQYAADNADNHIGERVIEWYRVTLAAKKMRINLRDISRCVESGKRMHGLYGSGQVPVSVSIDSFFDFMKNIKSEYDKVRFCIYLAIRSLAGNGVAITTAEAIRWRSVGARNAEEYKAAKQQKALRPIITKWHTRYYYTMILNDLVSAKLVLKMPWNRNTCVSASILNENEFVEALEAKIRSRSAAAKAKQVRTAQERMMHDLKKRLNTS